MRRCFANPRSGIYIGGNEIREPLFWLGLKLNLHSTPNESHGPRVQGVIGQDEPGFLFSRQSILDKRQVQIFIAAVKFVADNGMADVGEVNANLVFAPGAWHHTQQ